MVFGLCMFHGVILERRKFGPLGWNITYEFNESDRECALKMLNIFCDREFLSKIPWDALVYINGEITYGGRVTDNWDQRCLRSVLKNFSSAQILTTNYKYSESGIYGFPENGKILDDFKEYANSLPLHDPPEIFGMHENANIIFHTNETQFFVQTLLEGQPRMSAGGGLSNDEICLEKIHSIRESIARKINSENLHQSLLEVDKKGRIPSLTTVLLQEVERFNRLLTVLHSSLNDLEKAIKGFVVMSEALEAIYNSFLINQVPQMWNRKGFLSTKTLGNWIFDFQQRIDYIQNWLDNGLPPSSWICGLFFPQSFLTGTLQTFARKNNVPIDTLHFDFEVLSVTLNQEEIYRNRGKVKETDLYGKLFHPNEGIIIHGLFIEAGRWNRDEGGLCDANIGELSPKLPAVWLKPCLELEAGGRYEAPLYKTSVRAGVLSTTGHSTNFVLSILLESKKPVDFWILRGTALVTSVTD